MSVGVHCTVHDEVSPTMIDSTQSVLSRCELQGDCATVFNELCYDGLTLGMLGLTEDSTSAEFCG